MHVGKFFAFVFEYAIGKPVEKVQVWPVQYIIKANLELESMHCFMLSWVPYKMLEIVNPVFTNCS